ncbi:MAG: response regulator [Reichenbachiella sp.]|uniref:response regulator n=2 Tax=Reichenbachiella sp. TaxID=2184521 RepID=UPI0032995599
MPNLKYRPYLLIWCCLFNQPKGFSQNNTSLSITSSEDFITVYDSLIKSQQLDLAYNLLTEESNYLMESESYSKLYFPLLYKMLKHEYLGGDHLKSIALSRDFISNYPKEDTLLAYTYFYLGNSYYKFKEYDIAIDCYSKAKNIFLNYDKDDQISNLFENIANIYLNLKDCKRALEYFQEAKRLDEEFYGTKNAEAYVRIARTLTTEKAFERAQLYLDSAIQISENNGDLEQKIQTQKGLGFNYYHSDSFLQARTHYQNAMKGFKELGNTKQVMHVARSLVRTHYHLKDYNEALSLCESNLALAYSTKNLPFISDFSKLIYNILIKQEKYKEAAFVYEGFQEVQDSIRRSNKENFKYKVQMRLDAEKKIHENELLKQQKIADEETIRAQNILLISVCLGLILVIIISLIIYRTYIINKKLSRKIQEQSDRLKQLDEAKSRFFANISHDLRTPLTLIMGGIEQVLKSEDLLLTDKAERQLKTGLLNGERIIHLTNEINELIKLEDGKLTLHKKYIDVDKMLKLFVKMFDSMAQLKGIHLSYSKSIFEGAPILHIDPSQFEKVLFNLITNALKHTKEDDSVTVSLNKKGDNLIIAVIDSGEGIPEQNIPYIFERYYQAPETTFKTQEGFGIGLALVKEIIQKHGAKIEVKSKLGEGSEFVISMPQENVSVEEITFLPELDFTSRTRGLFKEIDEPIAEQIPVVNLARTSDQKRKTVLIVEDHPEIREYIQNIVEVDYNVLTAPNGQRALKVLDKEEVDLIITDLMMPWFDGFELLERLKENDELKKIPALVLSARTSEEDKTKVLSQGVNDFLCKPFKREELILRIENLLNQKELWNNNNEGALFINNQETLDDIEKSLLKKVESLIFERIDDPNLSVNCLADEIAVSERKFYRMIKKMTDSTPFEFIKEIRMQYANKILKEKKISSASEVAKAIGMNNVSHFNTQFKKRFGKTPTEFI